MNYNVEEAIPMDRDMPDHRNPRIQRDKANEAIKQVFLTAINNRLRHPDVRVDQINDEIHSACRDTVENFRRILDSF